MLFRITYSDLGTPLDYEAVFMGLWVGSHFVYLVHINKDAQAVQSCGVTLSDLQVLVTRYAVTTAKIQTQGFKMAVHKPMGNIMNATSIIYTVYCKKPVNI